MNSYENDEYWNESKLSKFNFEVDDGKGNDIFSTDILAGFSGKSNQDSSSQYTFGFDQNIEFESISNFLSEKCITCILESDSEKTETVTIRDLPLDEEVRLLRRQVKERWIPPSIEATMTKILLGEPYSFEMYRSFFSKKTLLKYAVKSSDGDAILAVIIFLSRTLKKSLFYPLLMDYPVAVSHYVHYLYIRRQMNELSDLLEALGRTKEIMMKQLTIACQNPQRILQRLRLLLKNYSFEATDYQIIENYATLIEWQTAASKITNNSSIIGESVISSLRYCNLHNLSIPLTNSEIKTESSASNFIKYFCITEKQSLLPLLQTHAERKNWESVEQLLIVKAWMGGKKLNTSLPIDKILEELRKQGASTLLLDKILNLVDVRKRTDAARKLGRHIVVIETLSKQKDKAALLQYMANLDPQSADYIYAENMLKTMKPKKPRLCYVGDSQKHIVEEPEAKPELAYANLTQQTLKKKNKQIKLLQQKNQRLNKRLANLQSLV
ncbi:hypothetical protein V9T40_012423 [Parthenolecanium corni]|uniref:Vps16 C-terminal domain-containing protein n=1 Tax=Parthenolecanium corni TaxID=536013 RepID=A0AAN9XZB4_9HEMI